MKNWRFYAIQCTSAFVQECKLALIRIGSQVWGPITQLSKELWTSVASMKNILLTGLEQTASLNDSTKTLVSTLTITRWTQGCWPFEQSCKESTTSATLQWYFFFFHLLTFLFYWSVSDTFQLQLEAKHHDLLIQNKFNIARLSMPVTSWVNKANVHLHERDIWCII